MVTVRDNVIGILGDCPICSDGGGLVGVERCQGDAQITIDLRNTQSLEMYSMVGPNR